MGRRKVLYFYFFLIYGSGRVGLGWVESGRVGSGWVGLEVWPGCIGAVLCGTMMAFVAMGDDNDDNVVFSCNNHPWTDAFMEEVVG
jgi:hypothetical protein